MSNSRGIQNLTLKLSAGAFYGWGERLIIARRIRVLCRNRKVAIDMGDKQWLRITEDRLEDCCQMLGVYAEDEPEA